MYKLFKPSFKSLLLAIFLHMLCIGLMIYQYIRTNVYINPAIQIQLLPYAPKVQVISKKASVKQHSLIKRTETINESTKKKTLKIKTVNNIASYLDNNANNPPIVYPLVAKKQRIEGTLILLLKIRENGTVQQILVEKSSGSAILDAVALKTINNWHFKAFKESMDTLLRLPITFQLD